MTAGGGHTGFSTGGQLTGSGARATGGGGVLAQPASQASAAIAAQWRTMAWVFLEVLAALAIAVAIVWWTFPKKPKDREGPPGGDEGR